MKHPPLVFFNGAELTTPEQVEEALQRSQDQTLLELQREQDGNGGRLPEDAEPDPIWKAIARATRRQVFTRPDCLPGCRCNWCLGEYDHLLQK